MKYSLLLSILIPLVYSVAVVRSIFYKDLHQIYSVNCLPDSSFQSPAIIILFHTLEFFSGPITYQD